MDIRKISIAFAAVPLCFFLNFGGILCPNKESPRKKFPGNCARIGVDEPARLGYPPSQYLGPLHLAVAMLLAIAQHTDLLI